MTDSSQDAAGIHERRDLADRLETIEADLAGLADELVPKRVSAQALARVVRSLGRIERRAGGARLVLTKAAADLGSWKAQGYRSPEEWAARVNGTTTSQARADLRASGQLAALPSARAAVGSGEVSTDAAKAVAEGASADPTAEGDLLGSAKAGDLGETRDRARRARQRADGRDGKAAQRMHRRRALRTWLELDGEGRGSWNVPPEYQARFLAALEPYRAEAFRLARDAGRRETPEALMADALDLLARDTLADLHIPDPTADVDAPDRGPPSNGTTNEPPGATATPTPGDQPDRGRQSDGATDEPPAATATRTPGDQPDDGAGRGNPPAGPDGTACSKGPPAPDGSHSGPGAAASGADARPERRPTQKPRGAGNRRPPAQLVVHASYDALVRGFALDGEVCEIPGLGPVPVAFARFLATDCLLKVVLTGASDVTVISSERRYVPATLRHALDARDTECVVPGCHARHHLERDHWGTDFAKGGPTSLANLARLCRYHHFLKTHCGWRLSGGPGHWRFEPP